MESVPRPLRRRLAVWFPAAYLVLLGGLFFAYAQAESETSFILLDFPALPWFVAFLPLVKSSMRESDCYGRYGYCFLRQWGPDIVSYVLNVLTLYGLGRWIDTISRRRAVVAPDS